MDRNAYATELGVSVGTIDNYRRALQRQGKRVTLATLRAHQRRTGPGRNADSARAKAIRVLRDRHALTWADIGEAFGFSGSRACAIYRQSKR